MPSPRPPSCRCFVLSLAALGACAGPAWAGTAVTVDSASMLSWCRPSRGVGSAEERDTRAARRCRGTATAA